MELIDNNIKEEKYIKILNSHFNHNISALIDSFITFVDKCKNYDLLIDYDEYDTDEERIKAINAIFDKQPNRDMVKRGDTINGNDHINCELYFYNGIKLIDPYLSYSIIPREFNCVEEFSPNYFDNVITRYNCLYINLKKYYLEIKENYRVFDGYILSDFRSPNGIIEVCYWETDINEFLYRIEYDAVYDFKPDGSDVDESMIDNNYRIYISEYD